MTMTKTKTLKMFDQAIENADAHELLGQQAAADTWLAEAARLMKMLETA